MTENKNKIGVIRVLNPLTPEVSELSYLDYVPGKTIEDLYPRLLTATELVISVNGRIVEDDDRALTYPQAGDVIVLCPVLGGGGSGGSSNGKTILRIVAMVVVAYFAGPLAANIAGASTGVGYSLAYAGIMMAGSMVVNAMLPPPKPKGNTAGAGSGSADSPTYGIDGPKNASAEGIVVPIVYGKHRFGGNLLNGYVTNDGDSQWLHLLFNCGEGPIAGITDIQINDSPIENFRDYQVEVRLGTSDQSVIPFFNGQVKPHSLQQTLPDDHGWIYYTTEDVVDQLRFDFVNPGGLYGYYTTKPDYFARSSTVEVQYRTVGSTDWKNVGSTANVSDYREEVRWLTVFYNFTYEVGDSGTPHEGVGSRAYIPDGSEVRVGNDMIGGPGTSYAGQKVGEVYAVANYVQTFAWSANQRTTVRRSFYSQALPQAKYEVRIRRADTEAPPGEGAATQWVDDVLVSDINEILFEPVAYQNTALLGIRIRLSDQLSGLPKVTHLNHGRVVQCWDAATGSWFAKASSNPAWQTLDALTNKRYGAGEPLARFDLDKWKEWAVHCDNNGLQFNGVFDQASNAWDALNKIFRAGHAGRTHSGTRHSVAIERAEAPRMMFSVANIIKGTFKQSWLPASDRANEIEATYIDSRDKYVQKSVRVVDSKAAAAGKPIKSAQVDFTGLVTIEEVWRDAQILLNQNRLLLQTVEFSAPLEAIACAVGDVVLVQHDMPRWSLGGRTEAGSGSSVIKLDRPVYMDPGKQYSLLLHYSAIKRYTGMLTSVQGQAIFISGYNGEPAVKRAQVAGRDIAIKSVIQSGSLFGVILDDVEGLSAGMQVDLWDTDAIETRQVLNNSAAPGTEYTQVTAVAPFPNVAPTYTQWMFGELTKTGKPFRIKAITGTHDYRRDIMALEYSADAYQTTPAPTPPNYSELNQGVKHSRIIDVDEEVYVAGTITMSRCTVRFAGQDDTYFTSAIYLSRNGGEEQKVGEDAAAWTVNAQLGDTLTFRVVARDAYQRNAPRSSAPTITHVAQGRTTLPGDATGLDAVVEQSGWVATWDAPTDPDVNASELRIGGTSWADARLLFRGDATSARFSFQPAGTHLLRLRHCIGQTDGLYSGEDCLKNIVIEPPIQPIVSAEVQSRTVSLTWQVCKGTQPLQGYAISVGPNALELEQIGFVTTENFQRVEPAAGRKLYWVQAYDVAGSTGAPGYIEVETLPDLDQALDEITEGLDQAVVDMLNVNTGLSDRILIEAANRGTAISNLQTVVDEGFDQMAQDIELLTAKAVGFVRANLLPNSGFELGMDWTASAGTWAATDDAWGRSAVGSAVGAAGSLTSAAFEVKAQEKYVFTGDSRSTAATGEVWFEVQWFNAGGTLLGTTPHASIVGLHDFSSERVNREAHQIEALSPATAATAKLRFVWASLPAGAVIAARQVKVERGILPPTPYSKEATDLGAIAALRTEETTRANAIAAEATARQSLAASMDGRVASVESITSATSSQVDGLKARWGIKMDVSGKVSGVLMNNDGSTSDFVVLVDRFAVATTSSGTTKYPFVVGNVGGTPTVAIDGNLLVDGTVKTRALEAESVTADKIKAKSITAAQIAAGTITADLINVGVAVNLLPDSAFLRGRNGTTGQITGASGAGWGTWENQTINAIYSINGADSAWRPKGVSSIAIQQTNNWYNGNDSVIMQHHRTGIPVEAGKRYAFSVYTGAHRCKVSTHIEWYDANGGGLGANNGDFNDEEKQGGTTLSAFKRIGGFAVAPPGAATAAFVVKKYPTKPGQNDSWLFAVCPMVAVATSAQTVQPDYVPYGQGVSITPDGIDTPSLSAITSNIGTVTAGVVQSADGKFVINLNNKTISITV